MSKKQTKALDLIAPNPANPRTITGERAQKLAEYLDEFGDLSGIVHNTRKGCDVLVSGHQRMEVFRGGGSDLVITENFSPSQPDGTIARGYIEMDGKRYTYRRVDWDKEKADRATIIANGQFGKWDAEKLAQWDYEPEELEEMGVEWGVDSDDESEGGIPNNALNSEKVEEDDFEVPEIETVKTDIVIGDLFEIGPHRLLCGDSTKAEDVDRLMGGCKVDMVFTDPPYGISHSGKGISGAVKGNDFGSILGDGDIGVAVSAFALCLDLFQSSTLIFLGANYYASALTNGYGWLIWDKQREGDVFSGAEIAFVNKGVRVDVFRHQWHGMIKASERNDKRVHPTQKPVALVSWCFNNYGAGRNILDLFLGSGTTMVASHQLNRVCYGMELEPKYCDVIVRRMLKLDNTLTVKRNGVDETDKWLSKIVIP